MTFRKMKTLTPKEIQEEQYITDGAYHWKLDPKKRGGYMRLVKYNIILQKVRDINPKTILEVGCGDGYFIELLRREFPQTFGLDYLPIALELAHTYAPNLGLIQSDAGDLPIESNSIDLICCIEMIEHNPVDDTPQIIQEMYRVLRKGGRLILT